MIKREQKAFYRYYYHADKLEPTIPYEFTHKGKLYRKIDEYRDKEGHIKHVVYEHSYEKGRYFESFQPYDLKIYVTYG